MRWLIVLALLTIQLSGFSQSDSLKRTPLDKPDPTIGSDIQPSIPERDLTNGVDPLIRIRLDAIPIPMRRSLSDQKYRGWEHAPVYHNQKTKEFLIDIRSGDSIRTFRFDQSGIPVEKQ